MHRRLRRLRVRGRRLHREARVSIGERGVVDVLDVVEVEAVGHDDRDLIRRIQLDERRDRAGCGLGAAVEREPLTKAPRVPLVLGGYGRHRRAAIPAPRRVIDAQADIRRGHRAVASPGNGRAAAQAPFLVRRAHPAPSSVRIRGLLAKSSQHPFSDTRCELFFFLEFFGGQFAE